MNSVDDTVIEASDLYECRLREQGLGYNRWPGSINIDRPWMIGARFQSITQASNHLNAGCKNMVWAIKHWLGVSTLTNLGCGEFETVQQQIL